MMKGDVKYLDVATTTMNMRELIAFVDNLSKEHPDQEIFLDGDAYAILGRKKH